MSDLVLDKVEIALIQGDLSKLEDKERVNYYNNVCNSLGLNPLTKPFRYINLHNKLTLYATKDCTDQLRKIYKISIKIVERKTDGGVHYVTAQATTPDGRFDEEIAGVNVANLKGESLANAIMKASTKAKRRVTLSICGLGMLDETEIESIDSAKEKEKPANPALPKPPENEAPTAPDESTIKKLREAYSSLAVDEQMLKAFIKKDLSKMTFEDLKLLRQTYNDIKQGNKDLNEVFG